MSEILDFIASDLGLLPSEIQDTNRRAFHLILGRRLFTWAARTLTSHTYQSLARYLFSNENAHPTLIDAYHEVFCEPTFYEPYATRILRHFLPPPLVPLSMPPPRPLDPSPCPPWTPTSSPST